MVVKKRILLASLGGVLLSILDFAAVFVITQTLDFSSLWVKVIAFPLRYGVHLNQSCFPLDDQSWVLIRWSDLVASFLGAFLFFGVLTYLVLLWWPRRPRAT